MKSYRRSSAARVLATSFVVATTILVLGAAPGRAGMQRWLCPDCPDEIVVRDPASAELACPDCQTTYRLSDLAPALAYINVSTRDCEVAWIVHADTCRIYRPDGLETIDNGDTLWVPWVLVDWYIPRMRLLRLIDGRELHPDYAKDRVYCPSPPRFAYEISDSLTLPNRPPSAFTEQGEYSLAELFIVAFSPEARDSARVRFIREVETGKHPRLPRTQPRVAKLPQVIVPSTEAHPDLNAEAIVEVRVHERRGIIGVRLVKSAGRLALDQEALRVAQSSNFTTGGEMGVGVPSWVQIHVFFEGSIGRLEVTPAPRGFWR